MPSAYKHTGGRCFKPRRSARGTLLAFRRGRRRRLWRSVLRRELLLVLALGLSLASAEVASADVEWAVVDQLGGDVDRDGVIDGARTAADAATARPSLRVRLTGGTCDAQRRYIWRLNGERVSASAAGTCSWIVRGVAPGAQRLTADATKIAVDVDVGERLIISIGDSVASGEGNPDVGADLLPARWLYRPCHRSMRSGHAQAAIALERHEPAYAVTFVALGCSGATMSRGLLGPYRGIEPSSDGHSEPPQVEVVNDLAERRAIDALLVSIGANDIHFSRIVQFCAAVTRCYERRFDPRTPLREAADRSAPTLDAAITAAVAALPDRFRQLADGLSPRIEARRVVLIQYFDPTTGEDGRFCSTHLGIGYVRPDEFQWAQLRVIQRLNAALAAVATEHGWTLVDGVGEAYRGHGICQANADERWVRTPVESFFQQDAQFTAASVAGTLHPNRRGHWQTASMIRARVMPLLGAVAGPDPLPPGADGPFGERTTVLVTLGGIGVVFGVMGAVSVVLAVRRRRRTAEVAS